MPVSSGQIAVVRTLFDAFMRSDGRAMARLVSGDMEFHAPTASYARDGRPYVGPNGMRECLTDATAPWEELRVEPRDPHESGDTVVALGLRLGRGPGGRRAGGLAVAPARRPAGLGRVFENQQEALEAAGLTAR